MKNGIKCQKHERSKTMPAFTVTSIIDGDTFEVSPQWKWNGTTGTRVRPAGYGAPEMHTYGGQAAKDKLSRLVKAQQVELREAHRVDRGRLVCDVFFHNKNLADYFPEYQ
jgi:endonuclease YncB( thermonuclease family)